MDRTDLNCGRAGASPAGSSGVEPIEERHREGLREAAEREPQIHRFTNMYTLGFDRWFDLALASETEVPFVVHVDDARSARRAT